MLEIMTPKAANYAAGCLPGQPPVRRHWTPHHGEPCGALGRRQAFVLPGDDANGHWFALACPHCINACKLTWLVD